MFHNQVQQVQQKLNSVQQLCAQMRQSEQNNQHKLQQIAQEEANAAQQLQRVQQVCQECVSNLQSIAFTTQQTYTQPTYSQPTAYAQGVQTQTYQPQAYAQSFNPTSQGLSTNTDIFDRTTMEPETYMGTLQTFGNPMSQQTSMYSSTLPQQSFQPTTSGSSLSNIATMNPDVYLASREQSGRNMQNLQQIGQQAGITTSTISSPSGSTALNISQPSGIMTSNRGFNQ